MSALLFSIVTHPRTLAAGAAALILTLLGLQTARLSHVKSELEAARASLRDPGTGRTWRSEAEASDRSLASCVDQRRQREDAYARQATAIASLNDVATVRASNAGRAMRAAIDAGKSDRRRAAEILGKSVGAEACRSADAIILQSLASGESRR